MCRLPPPARIRHTRPAKLSISGQIGGCFYCGMGSTLFSMKRTKPTHYGPQTTAIHAGEPLRHGVGTAVGPEICRTSTFTFKSTEEMKRWAEGKSTAYIYTRY